ncbi:hypothetical protein B9T36_06005 [Acinetobacter sp. ANC 4204]|nr:hypothetical protein B9T36_06005 [Acinetobacter sp. ANC 4204]
MTIKKVSSIAKLEDLGRIQLSKSFFMRDFQYPHPPPSPTGRRSFHCKFDSTIYLIMNVPSPF